MRVVWAGRIGDCAARLPLSGVDRGAGAGRRSAQLLQAIMTACRCPSCSSTPAYTWTPEYRLQCEARYLLNMPLRERQDALKHPARALRRADLEAEMKRQWQDGRAA